MNIKLISYNIWHGTRIEEAIAFLKREKADVLCLQEVGTTGQKLAYSKRDILTEIQEAVDMEAVYAPIYSRETKEGIWDIGVAIMSTRKFESSEVIQYAGGYKEYKEEESWHFGWPSAVLVTQIEGLPFTVATTHLPVTYHTQVTVEQMSAAEEVREAVEGYESFVLCGDMNTLPDSGTYRILAKDLKEATDHKAATLHPTIHVAGKFNFHVDYLFYRGKEIEQIETQIPIVSGSDHLPVVATIETKKSD